MCCFFLKKKNQQKHTPPSHPDVQNIREALEQLERVTTWINEVKNWISFERTFFKSLSLQEKRREFNIQQKRELEAQVENPEFDFSVPGRFIVHDGV